MSFATADLYDDHEDKLAIVAPGFRNYGGNTHFSGPIFTIKCHEDNSFVRSTLETAGNGRVLVVDGGGSMRCALLGDNLAQLGIDNGWAGVIVYGCIRDSVDIGQMAIGVKALDTNPVKSVKKNIGETQVPVTFGGVTFTPDQFVYADPDGIVVSALPLL